MRTQKFLVIFTVALILAVSLTIYIFLFLSGPEVILEGELYANDSGLPRGGFVWTGLYDLKIMKNRLILSLKSGLGDPLVVHSYRCDVLEITPKNISLRLYDANESMSIEILLEYYEKDPVWNLSNVYIAYYVNPIIFSGFKEHYYVEIRIFSIIQRLT